MIRVLGVGARHANGTHRKSIWIGIRAGWQGWYDIVRAGNCQHLRRTWRVARWY